MKEFKINDNLRHEITSVKIKGLGLDEGGIYAIEAGVASLTTAVKYSQQHKEIKKLLRMYIELIVKDLNDMEAMVEAAKEMDQSIAGSGGGSAFGGGGGGSRGGSSSGTIGRGGSR